MSVKTDMFLFQFIHGTQCEVKERIKNRIAITCNIVERENKNYLFGAERYTIKICKELVNLYDVHLFQQLDDNYGIDGLTIHSHTNNFFSKQMITETARRIYELKPNVIFCNAGTGNQALYWIVVSKMTKVPIIIFFHNEPKYIKDTMTIVQGLEFVAKQVHGNEQKFYEFVLEQSDKLGFLLDQYIPMEYKNKSYTFYNCIELPQDVDIHTKRNHILYVGRINTDVKRTQLLLDAVSDTNYHTDIVGYSYWDNGYLDMNDYKKYKNIYYHGYSNDVESFYKKANVLVIPSLYEGLPTVALEAFSYGVPVIGYKECKVMKDIIVNGYNGWLVDNDLKSCIDNAMNLDMVQIRENCIKESMKYDIKRIIKTIIQSIEDIE